MFSGLKRAIRESFDDAMLLCTVCDTFIVRLCESVHWTDLGVISINEMLIAKEAE